MKLDIRKLSEDKIITLHNQLTCAVEAATLALEAKPCKLEGEIVLQNLSSYIQVSGRLICSAKRSCERCGEDTVVEVNTSIDLKYAPMPTNDQHQRELQSQELDIGWYEEDTLDLTQVLSEALALALPERVLCSDVETCEKRAASLLTSSDNITRQSPWRVLQAD